MKNRTYQEILDGAIRGEIEAARFYANVAEKMESAFLKELFQTFSKEEQAHRKILEDFKKDPNGSVHFEATPDFHVSQTVDEPALTIAMKPAEAIALAMKKEEAAMEHYLELAQACNDPHQKKLFNELATMERGHKTKMEAAFVDIGYPEVW